jgi:O-antigen biosynthesis protein
MSPRRSEQFHLVPERGINVVDGETVAVSAPAWLRIEPLPEFVRHKWVRLRYSSSFFDEPVRPLIRFVTNKGDSIIQPMNGPVLGSAEWIGRVPDGTVSAAISPAGRAGLFSFRLDEITAVPRLPLVMRGLRHGPDWLYWAARSRLVDSPREASQALSFAAGGTPIRAYAQWRRRFARAIDLEGLDRPRSDWRNGPVFRLIPKLRRGDLDRLRATIGSLRAQVYPRWTLHAVTDATTNSSLLSEFREQAARDSRLREMAPDRAQPNSLVDAFDRNDFLALIDNGDRLPDYALAAVAETLVREPELDLVYSDEDCVTPNGELSLPILKPDWSPVFQEQRGYVGRLTLFRSRLMTEGRLRGLMADEDGTIDAVFRDVPRSAIRHIRRILYHRFAGAANEVLAKTRASRVSDEPSQWPEVAVVIPTRDKVELLKESLRGLRDKTDYPSFQTVVMDNGSTAADAVAFLRRIAGEPRTTVLQRSGPFNFSKLSNDGARATTSRVLVFLNNDVAVLDRGWLKAMVRWAIKPDVGVVGAKLLFPNGLIQHAGVVLGFGGIAGHIYRRLPRDHRGYLAQLTVPHEVAAVTGACIAVERSKFETVGGFDAENLPVDLNDIDFCLRIAEHGWTNIWTPEATLIHHQSATRGIDPDPFELYRTERAYFVQRWSHVIRDDPYFHPALSLHAHDLALA